MKNKNKQTRFPVVRITKPLVVHYAAELMRTEMIQARIKRIMQKDEEVGKVAQATPVVICKYNLFACLFNKTADWYYT